MKTHIEYVDEAWNVTSGCNGTHGEPCDYCYIKRLLPDTRPVFNLKNLIYPCTIKEPSRFMVGSMGDLMGPWNNRKDILRVLNMVKRLPQHTFLFLTKFPGRYAEFDFTKNCWLGTSVEMQSSVGRIDLLSVVKKVPVRFVVFEPILTAIKHMLFNIQWVVIGAETTRNSVTPRNADLARRFADPIIEYAKNREIPVFVKESMQYQATLKEFPFVQKVQEQGLLL